MKVGSRVGPAAGCRLDLLSTPLKLGRIGMMGTMVRDFEQKHVLHFAISVLVLAVSAFVDTGIRADDDGLVHEAVSDAQVSYAASEGRHACFLASYAQQGPSRRARTAHRGSTTGQSDPEFTYTDTAL